MDHLRGKRLEGLWWQPGEPDNKMGGVLEIEPSNHGKLTLISDRTPPQDWAQGERTFYGKISSGYDYEVTLLKTIMHRGWPRYSTAAPQRKVEAELFTNEIVVGAHVQSVSDPLITRARIRLTGFSQWCDDSGMTGRVVITEEGTIKYGR
jgi:hypothetical protein